MVDLPSYSRGIVTSEAPTSRLTGAEVAQPYQMLGHALDSRGEALGKMGAALEDVAIPFAERAGLESVSRDPNTGDLTISKTPIFGAAGVAYARAAKFSALAQGEAEARRQDILISKQFPNDPESYRAAANQFRDKMIEQYNAVSPEVGMALGKAIDSQTTYNYRWMWAAHQHKISRDFDDGTRTAMISAKEDVLALITDGAMETPDGRKRVKELVDRFEYLNHERHTNPVLGEPIEKTAYNMKTFDDEIGAARIASNVKKIMQDPAGGDETQRMQIAHDFVETMAKDKNLTPEQQAMTRAHGLAAIDDVQKDQNKAEILAKKVQARTDDDYWQKLILSTVPGTEREITENDVKTAPGLSHTARLQMLSFLKRDSMPEPTAVQNARAGAEIFRRMGLPEGDKNKITDLRQIREYYAPANGGMGSISLSTEQQFEKMFNESKTSDGESINTARKEFFNNYRAAIDPSLGGDPAGGQRMFLALKDARRQEDMLQSQGKDPQSVYDPRSSEYFGNPKNLQKYQKPLDELLKTYQQPQTIAPPAEAKFMPPGNWQYSPSRQQYRDPQGNLYDIGGRPIVPQSK